MQILMKNFMTKIVFNKNPVENTGQYVSYNVEETPLSY